jgi:hypothetical protein
MDLPIAGQLLQVLIDFGNFAEDEIPVNHV